MDTTRSSSVRLLAMVAVAWVVAAAAQAGVLGNPLVARSAPSDGANNVLEIYTSSPMPSDGLIDQVLLYKQSGVPAPADREFQLFTLRPTATPNQYLVTGTAGAITNFGTTDAVNSYPVALNVQQDDVFAHMGTGIPYQSGGSEPLYYPSNVQPAVGSTITVGAAPYPPYGTRVYSLAVNHVAGGSTSLVGNALVQAETACDSVENILPVYTSSPIPSDGVINEVQIYKQEPTATVRTFELFVLRPTGGGQYDVVASSGQITNYGTGGQALAYNLPDIAVEAGDLLAHYGRGIAFDQPPAPLGDPVFHPAVEPAVGTTIALPCGDYTQYSLNRSYKLSVNHVAGAEPSNLGNPLIQRAAPSDGPSNLLGVYTHSEIQAATLIDGASIYKQKDADEAFQVLLLRPTGAANQYGVVASSGTITTTGAVGQVQTYDFPNGPMRAEAGDLFAHAGIGIPYDTIADEQPLYYPFTATVGSEITLPASTTRHRAYSLQVSTAPAGGDLLGNALIPRASAADGSDKVFNVYWDSPIPGNGHINQVHIFNQHGRNQDYTPFEFFVLRPTGGANEYTCLARLGPFDPGTDWGQMTFDLDEWIEVQSGDLFAHYGRGMPYDQGGDATELLFHAVYPGSLPDAGDLVTLDTTHGYPPYPHLRRYSLAVTYVPEPCTLALLAMGGLGALLRRRRRA